MTMRQLVRASALALSIAGCNSEVPTIDCTTADVKGFSELNEVRSYCTDCHGEGRRDAGVSLATYDDAVAAAVGRGHDQGFGAVGYGQ